MNPTISENSSGENIIHVYTCSCLPCALASLLFSLHFNFLLLHHNQPPPLFLSIFHSFSFPCSLSHAIFSSSVHVSAFTVPLVSSHSTVMLSTHRKITYIYIDLRKASRRSEYKPKRKFMNTMHEAAIW